MILTVEEVDLDHFFKKKFNEFVKSHDEYFKFINQEINYIDYGLNGCRVRLFNEIGDNLNAYILFSEIENSITESSFRLSRACVEYFVGKMKDKNIGVPTNIPIQRIE